MTDPLPDAVIVDIDGTVALRADRSPYDWSRVGEDTPNRPVIAVVEALAAAGYAIVCVSGRSEVCRPATDFWLHAHVNAQISQLHMRGDGDNRADVEVKREIYQRKVRGRFRVECVLDDRDAIVAMWRELGLTCLQVAPGDF
ncbi:hypothetical protein [Natronoglycomyces albus]|uniref:Polynucleotide kinase PNKP phosphatase domain-containing protein n=1 Tax=Natronoglycomyces albus TaxID=2811108 RepID=A0A895XTP1_9ACTN|nr:hypothetical protein [Natronoglycomyces albus]QSB05008.1 hypothetical protein JQS30_14770 [Natronoglycomyces albus]